MLNIDFKIDGIEGVSAALEDMPEAIEAAIAKAVLQGAEVVRDAAKSLAPHTTGELIKSIIVDGPISSGNTIFAEVAATAEHAAYIEFGTGPKGAAAAPAFAAEEGVEYRTGGWVYPVDGGFRYTTGQPARPYMHPAYEANKEAVKELVANAIKKAVGG